MKIFHMGCLLTIFQNITLVDETGVPGENHRRAIGHCETLSHDVVSSTPHHVI